MPAAPCFFLQKSSQNLLAAPPSAPPLGSIQRTRPLLETAEIFVIWIAFADYGSQWLWELRSLNRESITSLARLAWKASTNAGLT